MINRTFRRIGFLVFVVTLVAGLVFGCGRPATEEDCQLIVDRLVELELRGANTTDASLIAQKQESVRRSMKDQMKDCVGRRVTNSMIACVRQASRPPEVLECIR